MTSSITKFRIHLRRASRNAITDHRKNVPKFTNPKLRTIRTVRYEKQASFLYRKLRFSLLKIVIYDFSVSRRCAFSVKPWMKNNLMSNLRGPKTFLHQGQTKEFLDTVTFCGVVKWSTSCKVCTRPEPFFYRQYIVAHWWMWDKPKCVCFGSICICYTGACFSYRKVRIVRNLRFVNLGTFLRRSVIAFLEALRKWIRNFVIDDVIYDKILLWRPFVAHIVLLLRT